MFTLGKKQRQLAQQLSLQTEKALPQKAPWPEGLRCPVLCPVHRAPRSSSPEARDAAALVSPGVSSQGPRPLRDPLSWFSMSSPAAKSRLLCWLSLPPHEPRARPVLFPPWGSCPRLMVTVLQWDLQPQALSCTPEPQVQPSTQHLNSVSSGQVNLNTTSCCPLVLGPCPCDVQTSNPGANPGCPQRSSSCPSEILLTQP